MVVFYNRLETMVSYSLKFVESLLGNARELVRRSRRAFQLLQGS